MFSQLLDDCMSRCGPSFHAEVGKFRFLNEMIKLVSPKYLGSRTPATVQDIVLKLLYSWTKKYPGEVKIKEAYEMLKKQGVVKVSICSVLKSFSLLIHINIYHVKYQPNLFKFNFFCLLARGYIGAFNCFGRFE